MKYLKNNWTLFLATLFIIFSLILISQCSAPDKKDPKWRYEIRGYVIYQGQKREAIWFTDTIEFGDNYLRYVNSDSSEVIIPAPYVLIDHKYDSIKRNNRHPFD